MLAQAGVRSTSGGSLAKTTSPASAAASPPRPGRRPPASRATAPAAARTAPTARCPTLPAPTMPIARPLYCGGNQPEPSDSATPKLAPAMPSSTPIASRLLKLVDEEEAEQHRHRDQRHLDQRRVLAADVLRQHAERKAHQRAGDDGDRQHEALLRRREIEVFADEGRHRAVSTQMQQREIRSTETPRPAWACGRRREKRSRASEPWSVRGNGGE